jgi:hypothetical protein
VLIPVWVFAAVAVLRRPGDGTLKRRAPRALPLLAGLGSVAFFTLVVGRAELRFVLPLGFFLSAYGGVLGDCFLSAAPSARAQRVAALLLGMALGWAGLRSSAAHLTQLGDARNEVRRILAGLPRGSVVETYGLLVYQPHFDVSETSPYRVQRVGPDPPGKRNPLVGALEREGELADVGARAPDVLVISEGFANNYLRPDRDAARPLPEVTRARRRDTGAKAFVAAATAGKLPGYRLLGRLEPELPAWAHALGLEPVSIQGTAGLSVWLLVAESGRARGLTR